MILTLIVQLVVIWALWSAIFAESGKDIVAGWDLQGILATVSLSFWQAGWCAGGI